MKSILFTSLFLFSIPFLSQKDSTNKWWNNIEIDGYFQFQYNYTNKADSLDLHSMSAGDFRRFNNNKFMVRRSRLQFMYNKDFVSSSFSFDLTERGFYIKDAWMSFEDKWTKSFRVTTGVFALPFAHEIELSSQFRESPERSRVIQHLFPGIRDIGVNLNFQLPDSSKLHFIKLDGGIYHGTGGNLEADNGKDFVGRFMIDNPLKSKVFNFSLAYSYLNGKVRHQYDIDGSFSNYHYVYNHKDTTFNVDGVDQDYRVMFIDLLPNELDSIINDSINGFTPATYGKFVTRKYHAISGQIDLDLNFGRTKLGKTTIRGEYIWGDQVSQEGTLGNPYVFSSATPTGPFTGVTWPKYDSPQPYNPATVSSQLKPSHTFVRAFRGANFYFDQQIGNSKHHILYKFDYYDPNTKVSGDDIRFNIVDSVGNIIQATGLSVADVAFTTHGWGYRYVASDHLSFMFYYENPRNEKTQLEPLGSTQINNGRYPHSGFLDEIKDDVYTIRIQYLF